MGTQLEQSISFKTMIAILRVTARHVKVQLMLFAEVRGSIALEIRSASESMLAWAEVSSSQMPQNAPFVCTTLSTPAQLPKIPYPSLLMSSNAVITLTSSARNIGVIFDSTLSNIYSRSHFISF